MSKKFLSIILAVVGLGASSVAFGYAGSVPSGLPSYFGFGIQDKQDPYATVTGGSCTTYSNPSDPDRWKDSAGAGCWKYSYAYLVPGWTTWSSSPTWDINEMNHWESEGEIQVFTFYYSYGSTAWFTSTGNMNGYWSDLYLLMHDIESDATVSTVILHFEPDGIGFWLQAGTSATASGTVMVGSATCPDPSGKVDGRPGTPTNFPNSIQGWSAAIWHMRHAYDPAHKILLAHHYTHWATGGDVYGGSMTRGQVDSAVTTMCNYIKTIETDPTNPSNSLPFDLFFADPSDRDADWFYQYGILGSGETPTFRWTDLDFSTPPSSGNLARTWGRVGYVVNEVSNQLGVPGFLWQIPIGNTYMKTCNNSNGHFRDDSAQAMLPSTSTNGSSGSPGDAYSSTDTTQGPGFWANHGILGVLFGSGYYSAPVGASLTNSNNACTYLTHARDMMGALNGSGDNTVPTSSVFNSGYTGTGISDTWGQHAPTNSTDDDGGYLRSAVAQYCATGPFPLPQAGTPTDTPPPALNTPTVTPTFSPSPTETPTPADCPLVLNSCDSLSENGIWSGVDGSQNANTVTAYVSTGTGSIQFTVATAASFQDKVSDLSGFAPINWGSYDRITFDLYVDPNHPLWGGGSTYDQLQFRVTNSGAAQYEVDPTCPTSSAGGCAATVNLATGWNHVSFPLYWTHVNPSGISEIFFVPSVGTPAAGAVYYIDNVVLHTDTACPPSPTPSASPSDTRTGTPSPTASPTASSTRTASPSPTRTPSPSPTGTPSGTSTASPTASATESWSPSPTRTASPSASPTATASATGTGTPTVTGTATLSGTSTASPTPPPAGSTATATPSQSPTSTASPTASATPSGTPPPTATGTSTPMATPTSTASSTPPASATPSPTPPPAGSTATDTPTFSPTATPSPTPSRTPSAGPTSTTGRGTPGPGGGVNQILSAEPGPNPNPDCLYVRLAGPADSIQYQVYTKAMVCVSSRDLPGAWQGGWNRVPLPAGFKSGLANGLYYMVLNSRQGGEVRQDPTPLLVYILK